MASRPGPSREEQLQRMQRARAEAMASMADPARVAEIAAQRATRRPKELAASAEQLLALQPTEAELETLLAKVRGKR